MSLRYEVRRAFFAEPKAGVRKFYTRENQQDVKELPREKRDELLASGAIEEFDDNRTTALPETVLADVEQEQRRGGKK